MQVQESIAKKVETTTVTRTAVTNTILDLLSQKRQLSVFYLKNKPIKLY